MARHQQSFKIREQVLIKLFYVVLEIKFREYGSKLVEVSDNGTGVEKRNFQGLTLKYHTSKIRNFEDLDCGVTTFGFRGEALSSLCALSNLVVTTRHASSQVATRIQYDHHGKIIQETVCARQVGTTVVLEDLFSTLPVRHKEFLRNLKREYQKMIYLLNAYCIISSGVKISCSNQCDISGKKSVILSTNGLQMQGNIASVFGSKQLNTLVKFSQIEPSKELIDEFGCKQSIIDQQPFNITGYVSSSSHGNGRACSDRQYLFINGRPCEIEKITKVINEVYHSYNKHQYPCVFLNIQVDRSAVDVNVTPDKRKVFLDYEPYLLASIKMSLVSVWQPEQSLYTQRTLTEVISSQLKSNDTKLEQRNCVKRGLSDIYEKIKEEQAFKKKFTLESYILKPYPSDDCIMAKDSAFATMSQESSSHEMDTDSLALEVANSTEDSDKSFCNLDNLSQTVGSCEKPEVNCGSDKSAADVDSLFPVSRKIVSCTQYTIKQITLPCKSQEVYLDTGTAHKAMDDSPDNEVSIQNDCNILNKLSHNLDGSPSSQTIHTSLSSENELEISPAEKAGSYHSTHSKPYEDGVVQHSFSYDDVGYRNRFEVRVSFSIEDLSQKFTKIHLTEADRITNCPKFRAKISNEQNADAEAELTKSIRKEDFNKMEVLGQFNLGFIITKLGTDLFIVDQHASDEKYNFEVLQKTTVMKRQKLLIPKPLNLPPCHEDLLVSNLSVFDKNGFEFLIKEDTEASNRVYLTAQPVSKNWTFDKDDIDEILYLLREVPNCQTYRPSRVRAMFASRACRKSVMIGKPLSSHDMYRLIKHMSEIDQPWNCPHGRPTMRHLVNLDLLTGS